MDHEVKHNLGSHVFSATDEGTHGIVIGITFKLGGSVMYQVGDGKGGYASYYAEELSSERVFSK